MLSFKILRHAIVMVANNLSDVFRLSAPMVAISVLAPFTLMLMGINTDVSDPVGADFNLPAVFLVWLVQFAITMWVLVAWHRYVLLEEKPGQFGTPVPAGRVIDYIGTLILVGLAAIVAMICVFIPVVLVGVTFGESALGLTLSALLAFAAVISLYPLILRLSVALPASAIGQPLGLRGAWQATQGQSMLCLGILLWSLLLGIAASIPLILLAFLLPPSLFILANAVFSVLYAIVGASVLTTLYGYFVEGRDLT